MNPVVQPRKSGNHPNMTENLLTGMSSIKTNKAAKADAKLSRSEQGFRSTTKIQCKIVNIFEPIIFSILGHWLDMVYFPPGGIL